jgi:GNAT superfamily N-acetyltransferase
MLVAEGKARAVWADDGHPARGFILYRERPLETELLGRGSAALQGPYLVDSDPSARQRRTAHMAARALQLSASLGAGFVSVKTAHDPAILRGFMEAGFRVAEATSCLEGPIPDPAEAAAPPPRPAGVRLEDGAGLDARAVLDGLGDLFYDGHHLHGPFLPEGFSGRLWRKVAERDLSSPGRPSLVALDSRQDAPVGLAAGSVSGRRAALTILHVAEIRRGQGLGRLLLRALSEALYGMGARTLSAETASWNLPALSLYADAGMRHTAPLMALHYAP